VTGVRKLHKESLLICIPHPQLIRW